jgi:hypothetical protein
MIVLKFIQVVVLLVALFVMIGAFYRFIQGNRKHSKRMKKLDQWSQFHKQLMDWSNEITDPSVKVDFINECVSKLVLTSGNSIGDRFDKDMLDDWDIDESKKNICDKWGKHIPSLLQEMRDNKLNQIL